jgi:hypothetical protein
MWNITERWGLLWRRPVNLNRTRSLRRSYSWSKVAEGRHLLSCVPVCRVAWEEHSVSSHLRRALVKEREVAHKSEKEEIIVFKIRYITTCDGEKIWRRNNEARRGAAQWMINAADMRQLKGISSELGYVASWNCELRAGWRVRFPFASPSLAFNCWQHWLPAFAIDKLFQLQMLRV